MITLHNHIDGVMVSGGLSTETYMPLLLALPDVCSLLSGASAVRWSLCDESVSRFLYNGSFLRPANWDWPGVFRMPLPAFRLTHFQWHPIASACLVAKLSPSPSAPVGKTIGTEATAARDWPRRIDKHVHHFRILGFVKLGNILELAGWKDQKLPRLRLRTDSFSQLVPSTYYLQPQNSSLRQ